MIERWGEKRARALQKAGTEKENWMPSCPVARRRISCRLSRWVSNETANISHRVCNIANLPRRSHSFFPSASFQFHHQGVRASAPASADQVFSWWSSLESMRVKVAGALWRSRIPRRAFLAKALDSVSRSASRAKRCCNSCASSLTCKGLRSSVSILRHRSTRDWRLFPRLGSRSGSLSGFPWSWRIALSFYSSWSSKIWRSICLISSFSITGCSWRLSW